MSKYDDIINLPHHVSMNHPRMSRYDRAAQFAPFAALTGYNEAINETSRLTDKKIILTNEQKENINKRIRFLQEINYFRDAVEIRYFIKDERKDGGRYITVTDKIKKIDEYNKKIYLSNGTVVNIEDIVNLQSECLINFDIL